MCKKIHIEKKEDPEALKWVLGLTYAQCKNLTLEEQIKIASIKPPKGYMLVFKEERDILMDPLSMEGKVIGFDNYRGGYKLVKEDE